MYISEEVVAFNNYCYVMCFVPMFISIMTEIQVISNLLLLKQRLNILNHLILEFKFDISNIFPKETGKPENHKNISAIRQKVFFISEMALKKQIKFKIPKKPNKSIFIKLCTICQSAQNIFKSFLKFLMKIVNLKQNTIFDKNFVQIKGNDKSYSIQKLKEMQKIHSKLYMIAELVSKVYGLQLIFIISIQFLTMTTLLYYCCMKTIRYYSCEVSTRKFLVINYNTF